MRVNSPRDFCAGVFFVALGIAFVVLSSHYHIGEMRRPGPAVFPMIVAVTMAVLGGVITFRSVVFADNEAPLDFHFRPIAVSVIAITLFGILLDWLGLVVAIVALVVVAAYATPKPRLASALILACAVACFSVLIFVGLLGLPIRLWPEL